MAARNIGELDRNTITRERYFLVSAPEGEGEVAMAAKMYRDNPDFPPLDSKRLAECRKHLAKGVTDRLDRAFNRFYGRPPREEDEEYMVRTRYECAGRRLLLQAGICQVEVGQYDAHGQLIDEFRPGYVIDELSSSATV